LATAIYVAMVTPSLYDNSYNLNDSNLKYESYWSGNGLCKARELFAQPVRA